MQAVLLSIKNNNASFNSASGIYLNESHNNTILNNTMFSCGILVNGSSLEHWNTHNIDLRNTVNGKPVYYWKDHKEDIIPSGAGEVILANCTGINITEQNLSLGTAGILLGFTSKSNITNNTCFSNNIYGIYLHKSNDNIFTNNTIYF